MDEKKTTGQRLKQIMNEKGLKQVDILNKTVPFQKKFDVKIRKNDLSQYINDKNEPRQDKLFILASALNVNEAWLMGYNVPRERVKDKLDNISYINAASDYNYFDAGLSAGLLAEVDPFTADDVQRVTLSDLVMGKYAGDPDVFISKINGESMNRVIPNGSMIAIKKFQSINELCNGDIVVFQDGGDMSVKRFYNDSNSKVVTFNPDSSDSSFSPINYRYEDLDGVNIVGKVVVYTVEI